MKIKIVGQEVVHYEAACGIIELIEGCLLCRVLINTRERRVPRPGVLLTVESTWDGRTIPGPLFQYLFSFQLENKKSFCSCLVNENNTFYKLIYFKRYSKSLI